MAKRLSGYNSDKNFIKGKYNLKGAFVSNFRNRYFNASSNASYTDVINFAYGLTNKQPDLFCSQFAILCYEAASIAAYGKTCMGSDPRAISPIRLEDNLNNRQDLFCRLGSFDYDDRIELKKLNNAIADYKSRKSIFSFSQSNATKLVLKKIPIVIQKDSDQYITEFVGYILRNPFLPNDKYYYFHKNYGKDFILNKTSTLYKVMMKNFSNLSATLSSNKDSVSYPPPFSSLKITSIFAGFLILCRSVDFMQYLANSLTVE